MTADNDAVCTSDEETIARYLERASRDLHGFLGWPPPEADTLRIDTLLLTAYEAACLARAPVEQAAYRMQRGEDDVSVPYDGLTSVGGISFGPPPPHIGPTALEALAGARLYLRTGCAAPAVDDAG